MKRSFLKVTALFLLLAVVLVLEAAAPAEAQYTTVRSGGRAGSWDFLLPLNWSDSASFDGQGGSHVDIDSSWGLGMAFGYNFTDRFQLSGMWSWNSRTYNAQVVGPFGGNHRYSNWMNTSALTVNGTFYFMDGKVSPFVTGGGGIVYVDTNIPTSVGGPTTCWWDPWYGYICDSYVPTKTENDITYNLGIGVRADIDRQFSFQAGYYRTYIDISKATSTPYFDNLRFDLIFRM